MKGKPQRSIRLSPMEGQILAMLEEAGAEDIPVVMNTLQPAYPELDAASLVEIVEQAIRQLLRTGLVVFGRDYGKPGLRYVEVPQQSLHEVLPLSRYISCGADGNWGWVEAETEPMTIYLMLTDAGKIAVRA